MYKIVLGGCLLSEAAANFVSPGLGKCLDLQSELTEDGDRETVEEMMEDEKTNVQLYECHGDHNQHFEIVGGQFRSFSMKDFCLTAAAIEDNADVHLEKCIDGEARQQWDLTGDGYVKVTGSEKCIDVKAAKKDDGTYEAWHEIREHKTVNVHLYRCHNASKTERVNQLWSWAPWKDGHQVTAKEHHHHQVNAKEHHHHHHHHHDDDDDDDDHNKHHNHDQKWEVRDLGFSGSTSVVTVALAGALAVGLFSLGALTGKRMHKAAEKPLASLAEE